MQNRLLIPSIEEILPPLVVGAAHQAHDVAARVQVEGTGLAHQFHAGFDGKLISLLAVAEMAASDQILPCGGSAAGAGDNVIERQLTRRQHFSTILAGIAIAQQDVLARQGAGLMRNATVLKQANDRGQSHGQASGVEEMAILFFGHGNSLEHKNNGPAGGTDVDRLIGRIQHQHRGVQNVDFTVGAGVFWASTRHARRQGVSPSHAERRIMPLP